MPTNPINASRFKRVRDDDPYVLQKRVQEIYTMLDRYAKILPIGSMLPYMGDPRRDPDPPPFYLYCDGKAYAIISYPILFSVLGEAYRDTTDNTLFHTPDARGKFLEVAPTNTTPTAQPGQVDSQSWQSGSGHTQDALYVSLIIRAL